MTKTTEEQIKNLDLNTYKGERHQVYKDSKLISDTDTRTLLGEKKVLIERFKQESEKDILKVAPMYKQLNANAGRLVAAETDAINSAIAIVIAKYEDKKQLILFAEDLEELELIKWK
jgi:hypothetical protein